MILSVLIVARKKINNKFASWFAQFEKIAQVNYFTNLYGLARSILAIGTMLTLLFNDTSYLYAEYMFSTESSRVFMDQVNLFYLFDYESLYIAKLISVAVLLLVISGYLPRYTGILHWWVSMSFYNSGTIVDGGDQIASVITFFLIPITLMDGRVNHWQTVQQTSIYKNFMAFFMFLLIEIQVAVIYFQAGVEKPYKVEEWLDGTAIYYWFNHNVFGGPEWMMGMVNWFLDFPVFISLLNWGVIIFEITLFGVLFMRRERRVRFLKYALLFHFSILVMHGLVSFFFAISAALILYLIPKNYDLKQLRKELF